MNLQRVIAAYAYYVMAHNHLHRRYLTLLQAVEEVANSPESDEEDIVILPLGQGDSYATDVEEEDEDVSHKNDLLPNDVAGTLAIHNEHNDKENEVVSNLRAIQIEGKTSQPLSKTRKKEKPAAVNWRKKQTLKEILEENSTYLANSHSHLAVFEPIALFQLLFNDKICDLIATETKQYSSQQNELFYLQQHEIDTFIGIILLTGYNSQPRPRLYSSKDDDVAIPLRSRSMSRKRLEDIKKFIYFADNDNLTAGDKLAKIRPLQDKVNALLQQFGLFEKDLSIDEQMVPYFAGTSERCWLPLQVWNIHWSM